jgi:predicted metal-dependent phosphoesterase TrpH
MRIDLHTHSDRSDGTDTPAELVGKARGAGLDVVALTDHDTTAGWAEAAEAAARGGITLVRGIEVSSKYGGEGVHLLAYLPDPTHPDLAGELDRILQGRNARLPGILAKLAELGIEIEESEVHALSTSAAATGRPHVADAMVAKGVVADRDEAFAKYLGPGGPAYVQRYAADLPTMIGIVAAAGGVTVLAHPWAARHGHSALDAAGLGELKAAGLAGVEVDHVDHDELTRTRLRALALELDLVITGSSDYHGTGKHGHALGCNTTDADQLDRLLDLAKQAAAASGRDTPDVMCPG